MTAPRSTADVPDLSVVIASYNSAAFLEVAVASALAQTGVKVEVIVVDDGSTDGSDALAERLAAKDPRVMLLRTAVNSGPGGARAIGFAAARAPWIAVLDSDDLMHPARAQRLLAAAQAQGADMVADDLLLFDDAHVTPPTLFLDRRRRAHAGWIGLADYLGESRMYGRRPNLGFLKPIFRREFLIRNRLGYDPRLRVAEDDALVISALAAGARYWLEPRPLYFYRKHGQSISHRLAPAHADAMRMASGEFLAAAGEWPGDSARAMARRHRSTTRAWAFTRLIDDLKRSDPAGALRRGLAHPAALLLLRQPIGARLRRLLAPLERQRKRALRPLADRPSAVVISKQRLVGAVNGSSAYLLALVRALVDSGFAVHLLQPSPAVFGRTPIQRPAPEMDLFTSHAIHGAVRVGSRFITTDTSVYAGAIRGVLARIAGRIGLGHLLRERPAPYSVATEWSDQDLLWLATHANLQPAVVLADYAFTGTGVPYLLAPTARTATVMHDCFHARAGQFDAARSDSVALLDAPAEARLLGQTDAVIAIQADEAAWVRSALPESDVLLAAMPAAVAAEASPGVDDMFLFVGSNTAPNILGLGWFVDTVWPLIRSHRPAARLLVAGSVRSALPGLAAPGLEMLGVVPDLAPLYRTAGVVVSPLLQGSGLKIKLIEALAAGKACVATEVTLQGVEWLAPEAVVAAGPPEEFAAACIALAVDGDRRAALAKRALAAARANFTADVVLADFRAWAEAAARP